MLIEFNVTNFLSINDTQTLSLVAEEQATELDKELENENTFASKLSELPHLVKSAVIYGPNAAGKSNLVYAIAFMQKFVKAPAYQKSENDSIEVKSFLLSENTQDSPTTFEVIFLQDGIQYQYGFALPILYHVPMKLYKGVI